MTRQEAFELIDEWAAEDPLDALREGLAECLSQTASMPSPWLSRPRRSSTAMIC
jgi:hypothetical protein